MSKDRDGLDDDERLAPEVDGGAAGDEPTDLAAGDPTDAEPTDAEPTDADPMDGSVAALEAEALDADADNGDPGATAAAKAVEAEEDAEAAEEAEQQADGEVVAAATVAGSARAAARQSGTSRVASTTTKKAAPTKPRETAEKTGAFARMGRFLREVVAELRKVIWPSRKQWATFTLVVIVFLVVMVALVSGMDVLFHLIVGKVFG